MYGATGLMRIVDIREETVLDEARKYYVLEELGARSASKTFVPVDNKNASSAHQGGDRGAAY